MIAYRRAVEDRERLVRRIRWHLAQRAAMHLDELRTCLGVDADDVRAELEVMMAAGQVERLRPIGYEGEGYDFYRLHTEPPPEVYAEAMEAGLGVKPATVPLARVARTMAHDLAD